MSHEVGKKKTRKQAMKMSKPQEVHADENKKNTTPGVIKGER